MANPVQVHAAPNGKFVGVNYDFASHPCLPEADVQVPSELRFPESSSIPVWMPVTAPVLTKAQSTFAPGMAFNIIQGIGSPWNYLTEGVDACLVSLDAKLP